MAAREDIYIVYGWGYRKECRSGPAFTWWRVGGLLLDGASSAGSCGSSSSGGGGGQEPHFDGDEHLQRRRVEVEGVVGPVLAVQRRRLLSEPLRRVQHPVDAPRAHLEQPSRCHGRVGTIQTDGLEWKSVWDQDLGLVNNVKKRFTHKFD